MLYPSKLGSQLALHAALPGTYTLYFLDVTSGLDSVPVNKSELLSLSFIDMPILGKSYDVQHADGSVTVLNEQRPSAEGLRNVVEVRY